MGLVSRFTHTLDLDKHIAVWNSLRLKPVFLERNSYDQFLEGIYDEETEKELVNAKILLSNETEDNDILLKVRAHAPQPDVGLAYFILSENCNLACRYCFVGSDQCHKETDSAKTNMSSEIADKALDVFIRQLEHSETDFTQTESNIIFFGGEPLLNFGTLVHVAERIEALKANHPVLLHTKLAIITNGTLLNEERIQKLASLNIAVSISIDGFDEESNQMRVDKAGNSSFARVLKVLDTYKELGIDAPSLSVTLTETPLPICLA